MKNNVAILTENEKIIMKYLQKPNICKEDLSRNRILTESLQDAIQDSIVFISNKVKGRLTSRNNIVEISAYIIYAIALLCKNKPETLRPIFAVSGGLSFGIILAQGIFAKSKKTYRFETRTLFESLFSTPGIMSLILVNVINHIKFLQKLVSPTSTTDITKKIVRNAFPVVTTFTITGIAGFILASAHIIAQNQNKSITEANYLEAIKEVITRFKEFYKHNMGFGLIVNTFFYSITLLKTLAYLYLFIVKEKEGNKTKKEIIQKIIETSKKVVEEKAIKYIQQNEAEDSNKPKSSISIVKANRSKLESFKSAEDAKELILAHFDDAVSDAQPIIVTNKQTIYTSTINDEHVQKIIEKVRKAIFSSERNLNSKTGLSYIKDMSDILVFLCEPTTEIEEDKKIKPYSFFNGFVDRRGKDSITVLMFFDKTSNKSKPAENNCESNEEFIEFVLLHECGHILAQYDYAPFILTDQFTYLTRIFLRNVEQTSFVLLRSAISYLGYVTSVHTELEADAIAAYLVDDKEKIENALKCLEKVTSGFIDDPHSKTHIRKLSALQHYKMIKNKKIM